METISFLSQLMDAQSDTLPTALWNGRRKMWFICQVTQHRSLIWLSKKNKKKFIFKLNRKGRISDLKTFLR